jgi:hypothetical protein
MLSKKHRTTLGGTGRTQGDVAWMQHSRWEAEASAIEEWRRNEEARRRKEEARERKEEARERNGRGQKEEGRS